MEPILYNATGGGRANFNKQAISPIIWRILIPLDLKLIYIKHKPCMRVQVEA